MAFFSVFPESGPPGTYTIETDGTPTIRFGMVFYQSMPLLEQGDALVGARIWMPGGTRPEQVIFYLYLGDGGHVNDSTALRDAPYTSVTVSVPAGTSGQWVNGFFPESSNLTADDQRLNSRFMVAAEFTGTNAAGRYVFGAGARNSDSTGNAVKAVDNQPLWWAEHVSPNDATLHSNYFKIGTTYGFGSNQTSSYGLDLIFDSADGQGSEFPPTISLANQSVVLGNSLTMTPNAADPNGDTPTVTWQHVSGPSTIVFTGGGNSRTITPTVAGTYVIRIRAEDATGLQSAWHNVTITVSDPGLPTFDNTTVIGIENSNFGVDRSQWFDGVGSEQMPAFARKMTYKAGTRFEASVDYNLPYNVEIYRLGHYQGYGARRLETFAGTPTDQADPTIIPDSNGAVTCAHWTRNVHWDIPPNAVSGWYYALLKGTNGSDFGHILFNVAPGEGQPKGRVLIMASDSTWHAAYNGYGVGNLYGGSKGLGDANQRTLCVTYDKPVITKEYVPQTHFFNSTYPYLKWSERMGIDADYLSIEAVNADPTLLQGRDLIVWTGHNEYVPENVFRAIEGWQDGTVSGKPKGMINVTSNDFFWRVRFTDGAIDSSTTGRNMWCRKDTLAGPTAIRSGGAGVPFSDDDWAPGETTAAARGRSLWTGTWQDTRWVLPEGMRKPTTMAHFKDRFIANGVRSDRVVVPESMSSLPAWRHCDEIQDLPPGGSWVFAAGTLGMEWDMVAEGFSNANYRAFSHTVVDLTDNASDINGEVYTTDLPNAVHNFIATNVGYNLFNFCSDQWSWALDSFHLRTNVSGPVSADFYAMQMMLNVTADAMGNSFMNVVDPFSVSEEGLTLPTPVVNFSNAYSFSLPTISGPSQKVTAGIWYDNGSTLRQVSTSSGGGGSAERDGGSVTIHDLSMDPDLPIEWTETGEGLVPGDMLVVKEYSSEAFDTITSRIYVYSGMTERPFGWEGEFVPAPRLELLTDKDMLRAAQLLRSFSFAQKTENTYGNPETHPYTGIELSFAKYGNLLETQVIINRPLTAGSYEIPLVLNGMDPLIEYDLGGFAEAIQGMFTVTLFPYTEQGGSIEGLASPVSVAARFEYYSGQLRFQMDLFEDLDHLSPAGVNVMMGKGMYITSDFGTIPDLYFPPG